MKTIETYLPVFPGFYGTIFEPDTDQAIDNYNEGNDTELGYDDLEFNYEEHESEVGEAACEFVANELGMVAGVVFDKVHSPKYYNFGNDSIHCSIELDMDQLKGYLQDNIKEFEKYLKDNYTSRPGFIPNYGNEAKEWIEHLLDAEGDHCVGSALEFVMKNENDESELDMYYYCSERSYLHATKK